VVGDTVGVAAGGGGVEVEVVEVVEVLSGAVVSVEVVSVEVVSVGEAMAIHVVAIEVGTGTCPMG
jgi:hypothetical protein